jgi:hypothetical protein
MKGEKLQMKFNLINSFAAGMLITTIISGSVYFSTKSDVSKTPGNQKVQLSDSEMIDKLASEGYIVQTKAELDKKIKDSKSPVQTAGTPAKSDKSNKVVFRVMVSVSDGMTSIDVGKQLVNAKIIPNAFKFSQDVEKKDVEKNLRPGTFSVDSGMSIDQIIDTIFKK